MKKNEKVFNDKSINVNYTSDKKYYIDADYVRIEQVINNLLSNAIYHTEENKSINIELNNGKFIIENEGELISKDKIELIWDTFYRGDSSRDRSERRTGIGLAIVKNVLQLHNFKFGVENTTIGVRFWFEF
jgi:signal transduction histidine kinase